MSTAVIAFGGNQGDRRALLQQALTRLADGTRVRVIAVSGLYETAPVGGPDQDDFLNAVARVSTDLTPKELLHRAQEVEAGLGRRREVRWGPRTVDIDIVDFDGLRSEDPELTLPHPRAHERAFVLRPWQEVDPGAELGDHGPVGALLPTVADQRVHRRDDLRMDPV